MSGSGENDVRIPEFPSVSLGDANAIVGWLERVKNVEGLRASGDDIFRVMLDSLQRQREEWEREMREIRMEDSRLRDLDEPDPTARILERYADEVRRQGINRKEWYRG